MQPSHDISPVPVRSDWLIGLVERLHSGFGVTLTSRPVLRPAQETDSGVTGHDVAQPAEESTDDPRLGLMRHDTRPVSSVS